MKTRDCSKHEEKLFNGMPFDPPGRYAMVVFRCVRVAIITDLVACFLPMCFAFNGQAGRFLYIFSGGGGAVAFVLAIFSSLFGVAFVASAKWSLFAQAFAMFIASLFGVLIFTPSMPR
ncbi:MAG: hypothetical protein WCD79_06965 [Chthoniobacteraceae bacterium]